MAIIELDQLHDTPLTTYVRGLIGIRFAYFRSKDSAQENERGQDYLLFRVEHDRIAFAVCDGVGNSFFGGLGAQIIGESLVSWLWGLEDGDIESNRDKLSLQLTEYLNAKKDLARELVSNKEINKFTNELQRDAYRNQLDEHGTQTNFVCGLIHASTNPKVAGQIALFWLGDAKLQIWQKGISKTKVLSATWESSEGWSSKYGVIGKIHSHFSDSSHIDCVIAHTDGLNSIESKINPGISNEELKQDFARLRKEPKSDDISFLQIYLPNQSYDFEDDLSLAIRKKLEKPEPREQKKPNTLTQDSPSDENDKSGSSNDVVKKDSPHQKKHPIAIILSLILVAGMFFGLGMAFENWNHEEIIPTAPPATPHIRRTVRAILTELAPTPTHQELMASATPFPSETDAVDIIPCGENNCETPDLMMLEKDSDSTPYIIPSQ